MGAWQASHMPQMREAMNRWGIKWGGDMSRRDTPHFEWGGTEGTHAGAAGNAAVVNAMRGATKPDLTNNPGDIHFPGSAIDYGQFGGTRSTSGDQGASLYQFPTLAKGFAAMKALALHKYASGMRTANQIIAGQGGWTPGALGAGAARNIAGAMGLDPDSDLGLNDPHRMTAFQRALATQEGSSQAAKWFDHRQHFGHPAVGAPPHRDNHFTLNIKSHMDGRLVGQHVEKHIVRGHMHTSGPAHHDGRRGLTPVDSWSVA
jgi:hypothetical protein